MDQLLTLVLKTGGATVTTGYGQYHTDPACGKYRLNDPDRVRSRDFPAFVSPNVWIYLVEQYQITPISTPEKDLATILG